MKKLLTVSSCVLGLVLACIPAYASPTSKKITLDCSSVAPDIITGNATVTLCGSSTTGVCGGLTFTCPSTPVYCDSSGATAPISTTVGCIAPFRVDAMSATIGFIDYAGSISSTTIIDTGGSSPASTLSGRGFTTTDGYNSDTVTLTVK